MTTPTVAPLAFRTKLKILYWQALALTIAVLAYCIRSPALIEWCVERFDPKEWDEHIKLGHHD